MKKKKKAYFDSSFKYVFDAPQNLSVRGSRIAKWRALHQSFFVCMCVRVKKFNCVLTFFRFLYLEFLFVGEETPEFRNFFQRLEEAGDGLSIGTIPELFSSRLVHRVLCLFPFTLQLLCGRSNLPVVLLKMYQWY